MTARIRPAPIRHAPAPAPVGSLDVFVTVCGELAEIAKATPRAAMVIDYPHRGRQPGHHRAQRAPFGP
ncbi:hypothetical protein MXD61_20600 [Frankia sp. AgPm24]|nr:hypothetical protein [Frankia sp. AgPm24]